MSHQKLEAQIKANEQITKALPVEEETEKKLLLSVQEEQG